MQQRRPATLQDVAALAQVSHQTVSRVVNGAGNVRPATAERVRAAIAQLDYRQNLSARALAAGRSGLVGAVIFGSNQFGPQQVLLSIDRAARAAGYRVAVRTAHDLVEDEVRGCVDELLQYGVEAILLIAAHDSMLSVLESSTSRVPMVVLAGDEVQGGLSIGIDNRGGARLATRHLLDLGHRAVVHVGGPGGWTETSLREQGWRDELEAAGLVAPPVRLHGDWSAASGYAAAAGLPPETTAVFVANDQMALGLVAALTEAGRDVPADVSVVGFDDLPEAAYLRPPLTTVRQDFAELGRRAMDLLTGLLRDGAAEETLAVPCELVVRSSTAPPPATT